MDTAGVIRIVLVVDIIAMALLAFFYLRQRRLPLISYCLWGLIVLLVPLFGPFLLIACRPGEWHPDPFPSSRLRQGIRRGIARFFYTVNLQVNRLRFKLGYYWRNPRQ